MGVWQLFSGETLIGEFEGNNFVAFERSRLPYELAYHGDIMDWLRRRSIDLHRTNSRILRKALRMAGSDELACVKQVNAASITDDYWIRDKRTDVTYASVRFDSDFFARLALKGSFLAYSGDENKKYSHTPELTNTGSYEKCWVLENGKWVMLKSGTVLERFSELFVYNLGDSLGFDMCKYSVQDDTLRTEDFTEGIFNFDPMYGVVLDDEDYLANWNALMRLDESGKLCSQYLDILLLDALVFNVDRHTFNYGILRDKATGAPVRMAPNFDNNLSLISRGYSVDPETSSPLLIDLFVELIKDTGAQVGFSGVDEAVCVEALEKTMAEFEGEQINTEFVKRFILSRSNMIMQRLH